MQIMHHKKMESLETKNKDTRNKDIRNFISLIENTIIDTLKMYDIDTFADKQNIGIWHKNNSKIGVQQS